MGIIYGNRYGNMKVYTDDRIQVWCNMGIICTTWVQLLGRNDKENVHNVSGPRS